MQGLSTTGCKWTASGNASSPHTPASDSLKRRGLLEEFIVWYFGSFVAPLLRASLTIPICFILLELISTDYLLCYRILGIQEQNTVLPSRRLGCALRTPY
jgi:hypothetical protein